MTSLLPVGHNQPHKLNPARRKRGFILPLSNYYKSKQFHIFCPAACKIIDTLMKILNKIPTLEAIRKAVVCVFKREMILGG